MDWTDAESASDTLVRIATEPDGSRFDITDPSVSAPLRTLLIHGIPGEGVTSTVLQDRRLGFFRLDGLERDHVKQVLARCYIADAGLLKAVVENPALSGRDVADLATKLWDGPPGKSGSLWATGRQVLLGSERVAARALGELSRTWWDTCWPLAPLAERLATGGVAAVEVYTTLAEDAVRERRLSGINGDENAELVDQALLLVGTAHACR